MGKLNLLIYAVAIATIGYRLYYHIKWPSRKKVKTNKTLRSPKQTVGKVKQIYFYALEGGHPMEVQQVLCSGSGSQYAKKRGIPLLSDRNFIVYTENNNICYNNNTKLVTVCLTNEDSLQLQTITDGKKLQIESEDIRKDRSILVNYKNQKLQAYDCGDRAAQFLSESLLNKPNGLRLGQFVNLLIRDRLKKVNEITGDPKGDQCYSLECMQPEFNNYSLISDESIDFIKRLQKCNHVTPQHFRAHIVIELFSEIGVPIWKRPFIEDRFGHVEIGSASFTNITLRSVTEFVNVDPQTGIRSSDYQPHQELKSFRKAHDVIGQAYRTISDPLLGINMNIERPGLIRVGDKVRVEFKANF